MKPARKLLLSIIALVASAGLVLVAGFNVFAQDPGASTADDGQFPATVSASIYEGTCDTLGAEPLYLLGNLTGPATGQAGNDAGIQMAGYADVEPMVTGGTNVEAGIDTLFSQGQVLSLVVADADAAGGDYLVCGELGGFVANGQIAVALTSASDSTTTYSGVAVFGAAQQDANSSLTPVQVYVFQVAEESSAPAGGNVPPSSGGAASPEPGGDNGTPTVEPTMEPTSEPTTEPTVAPTTEPTVEPTTEPTVEPTTEPTVEPTTEPTVAPTTEPTTAPTIAPTTEA